MRVSIHDVPVEVRVVPGGAVVHGPILVAVAHEVGPGGGVEKQGAIALGVRALRWPERSELRARGSMEEKRDGARPGTRRHGVPRDRGDRAVAGGVPGGGEHRRSEHSGAGEGERSDQPAEDAKPGTPGAAHQGRSRTPPASLAHRARPAATLVSRSRRRATTPAWDDCQIRYRAPGTRSLGRLPTTAILPCSAPSGPSRPRANT